MALSKSVNIEHAQRAVPCNICEEEIPGEYYCIECKQTLCSKCEKNHKRVAATINHNILLRAQYGEIYSMILNCTDHLEQASFHCENCNIPVCIKCVTGKHKGHNMSDFDYIFEREKRIIQADIYAMKRDISILQKHRREILTEKDNYKKKIKKILRDIESDNDAVVKEIRKIQKERVNYIHNIQESHLAVFDGIEDEMKTKINCYENRISDFEDRIKKNNPYALINIGKGKWSISESGSKPKIPDPPLFEPANLNSIVENVGKLYTSPSSCMERQLKLTSATIVSRFQSPLQGFPKICIEKEGDVWLGGVDSKELVMVDIHGQVLRKRKIQHRPNSLAVMDSGDVIISPRSEDSKSVSRLLRDGTEQHVFDASPSRSFGVSVTAEQKILICTRDGRVVRINSDGTDVKEIYKGSGEWSAIHAVEKSDGVIFISDLSHSTVVMVSKDGNVLSAIKYTTGGTHLGRPYGMVVDKMDNILWADINNDCVYIIDRNYRMKELVGRSHGIKQPDWLAVDNNNNLWITQEGGNVHVLKYLFP